MKGFSLAALVFFFHPVAGWQSQHSLSHACMKVQPRIPLSRSCIRHKSKLSTFTNLSQQGTTTSSSTSLSMSLIPLEATKLEQCLCLGLPSGEQYGTYWGRTPRERYDAIFESVAVTFLGLFFSYFISFVVGGGLATLLGFVAASWTLLGPEWRAYQRNWDLLQGRVLLDPPLARDYDDYDYDDGMYGALYVGAVDSVTVLEHIPRRTSRRYYDDEDDVEEYTLAEFQQLDAFDNPENDLLFNNSPNNSGSPYTLELRVSDAQGRTFQINARMDDERYFGIRRGMVVACLVLSNDAQFSRLKGMTDVCIPAAGCYVGDYPYLDKASFERMLTLASVAGVSRSRRRNDKWMENIFDDDYNDEDDYEEDADEDVTMMDVLEQEDRFGRIFY